MVTNVGSSEAIDIRNVEDSIELSKDVESVKRTNTIFPKKTVKICIEEHLINSSYEKSEPSEKEESWREMDN